MMTKMNLVKSAFAGAMLLGAGNAVAAKPPGTPPNNPPSSCAPDCVRQNPVKVSAPEIDVSSGGSAIALLITAMLIAAERRRRT